MTEPCTWIAARSGLTLGEQPKRCLEQLLDHHLHLTALWHLPERLGK